jgi:hypothetical protein
LAERGRSSQAANSTADDQDVALLQLATCDG